MDKKIIAIAVGAALAIPVTASAGDIKIKVYGALQAEIANIGVTDAAGDAVDSKSGTIMEDNKRGRLGVKVSDPLGGGLTAVANFEWQVETTQGQVNDGTRVGMVGIKTGFGTISLGSLKSGYKYTGGVKYDPFVTTLLQARSAGGMSGKEGALKSPGGLKTTGVFGNHSFLANAIGYSGKFGMVKISAQLSPDELGNNKKGKIGDFIGAVKFGNKMWEGFVAFARNAELQKVSEKTTTTYANDPLTDVVTATDTTVTTTTTGDYLAWKVGGKFKMKMGGMSHTILGQFENMAITDGDKDVDGDVSTLDGKTTGNIIFIGYHLGLGKTTVIAQLGLESLTSDPGTTGSSTTETKTTYFALGGIHKFNKLTRLFGGISQNSSTVEGEDAGSKLTMTVGLRKDFK